MENVLEENANEFLGCTIITLRWWKYYTTILWSQADLSSSAGSESTRWDLK